MQRIDWSSRSVETQRGEKGEKEEKSQPQQSVFDPVSTLLSQSLSDNTITKTQ